MTTSSVPAAPEKKPEGKPERKTVRLSAGTLSSALGLLLAELLLPLLLAGGLVWYLFTAYNLWALNRTLSLVLYGVAVVLLALIMSVVADSLLVGVRAGFARAGAGFSNNANLRFIKMALGGLVLPLAALIAANLVSLPNSATAMTLLIDAANRPAKLSPPAEVAQIASGSKNPATRLYAIEVLQNFRSTDALDQLIQLANTDSEALANAGTRAALVKAVASYGLTAKTPLLAMFRNIDPSLIEKASGMHSGLYERYFGRSFESLQTDSDLQNPDPAVRAARTAQIQAAELALQKALNDLEKGTPASVSGDARLDFVLQVFLSMENAADKDVMSFAKATAADKRFPSQVRGDALLLVAKLGDKSDMSGLLPYLQESDTLIQDRALQAIAALQNKINHTVGK